MLRHGVAMVAGPGPESSAGAAPRARPRCGSFRRAWSAIPRPGSRATGIEPRSFSSDPGRTCRRRAGALVRAALLAQAAGDRLARGVLDRDRRDRARPGPRDGDEPSRDGGFRAAAAELVLVLGALFDISSAWRCGAALRAMCATPCYRGGDLSFGRHDHVARSSGSIRSGRIPRSCRYAGDRVHARHSRRTVTGAPPHLEAHPRPRRDGAVRHRSRHRVLHVHGAPHA